MNKPSPRRTFSLRFPPRSHACAKRVHESRGHSLIELLAVVCLVGVLATVAVPAMSSMMGSIQLTSTTNGFFSHILLARSEAIKRNSRVALCKSSEGISCAATGGWEQGWIVFHDINNNGTREDTEPIMQRELALPASLRLTGNLNVAHYLSFASTGAAKLVGGGFQAGTLTVCQYSAGGSMARQIVLNAAGRPRVQKGSAFNCD
jgi:type IV fimbrial biogenesis protein FimT